jgi:LmbE family N-acetylglucosaminyl deacetylase
MHARKVLSYQGFFRTLSLSVALLGLVFLGAGATSSADKTSPTQLSPDQPLPQDSGAAGLRLTLKRLATTGRLMHTTAHPDDEDGGMLTVESRGVGTHTLLMTLNRGEGGQNKVGSSLLDSLGVLRTLELLAAGRYYGVEQRFSRVADFGFSKNPEETLQKWQGHDVALGDMVRVIRSFHPDVLVARFTGTSRDGHGNHQASAILTREAFRAAGDPNRFPEQIRAGLLAWQPKKFYMGKLCWDSPAECEKDYTVRINSGKMDPDLKSSYIQFAMAGLRHQMSQGAANWTVEPGDRFSYYKLEDSVLPSTTDANGHEPDFFAGIDTTLPGLVKRLGEEEKKVPFLRGELEAVEKDIRLATAAAEKGSESAAEPLFGALGLLRDIQLRIMGANLSVPAQVALGKPLNDEINLCSHAIDLALNISLEATTSPEQVSPGEPFTVTVRFHNGSHRVLSLYDLEGEIPGLEQQLQHRGDPKPPARPIPAGGEVVQTFHGMVPPTSDTSKPYWHREDPATESVNIIDDPKYATLPFPGPHFYSLASYSLGKTINQTFEPVMAHFTDDQGASRVWPVPVVPAFSVLVEPATQLARVNGEHTFPVKVHVESKRTGDCVLRLQVPDKARVEPEQIPVHFSGGGAQEFNFQVLASVAQESRAVIRAVCTSKTGTSRGKEFSEGYSLITREDLGAYYYFQQATQKLSVVTAALPENLRVGYIMGAGDEIPTALQQLGINTELIPAESLHETDLARFSTIVLGIRAYDTQKDVIANNKRLLDYASNGGTLIVQYNSGVGDFNNGKFTPFPAQVSRARVSVEESPVQILAPEDGIFHYPNEITAKDFDGWVQERGLNFMETWDSNFKPLLACNDPGEPLQKGGLLRAKYGKGVYIFTGYAFFRQLPAGVPGAVRLYVNLLSAGHEPAAQSGNAKN